MSEPCNVTYVPNPEEYVHAMGWYGVLVLTLGSVGTVGLFVLFFKQVRFTQQNADFMAKRHIYWISSIFPLMSLLSLVALSIPKANYLCTAVKVTYMSIGISHFADLTMVMFGGERMLAERGGGTNINFRKRPLCCRSVPSVPVTKTSVRVVMLLTEQLPFTQALYFFLVAVLQSADSFHLGDMRPSSAYLWLTIFKLTSCFSGVYGLRVLSHYSKNYLTHFNYSRKSKAMQWLVLLTNFQGIILNIMAYYKVFPCVPPYISSVMYQQTVGNSLYLLGMLLIGSFTFREYYNNQFKNIIEPFSHHSPTPVTGAACTCSSGREDNCHASTGDSSVVVSVVETQQIQGVPNPLFPASDA